MTFCCCLFFVVVLGFFSCFFVVFLCVCFFGVFLGWGVGVGVVCVLLLFCFCFPQISFYKIKNIYLKKIIRKCPCFHSQEPIKVFYTSKPFVVVVVVVFQFVLLPPIIWCDIPSLFSYWL